nr:hypothetical protein [Halomonas sp. HL-48]
MKIDTFNFAVKLLFCFTLYLVTSNAMSNDIVTGSEWLDPADEPFEPDQWKNRRDPEKLKQDACEYRAHAPYAMSESREYGLSSEDAIAELAPFVGYELAASTARYIYADFEAERVSRTIYESCMREG